MKDKIILGLNCNHADSSACILVDGKIEYAIEEERINRIKHFLGFPTLSINQCLKYTGLKINDVTDIAVNTNPWSNIHKKILHAIKYKSINHSVFLRYKNRLSLKKILLKNYQINSSIKFHLIEHHLSHLASAFYPSGFDDALGISIDGSGDFVTCALSICEGKKISIKKKIYFPDSLGIFYQAMTQYLGFKNYGDEYKLMGLASYGKPIFFDQIKNQLFLDKKNLFKLNLKYFRHHIDLESNFQDNTNYNELYNSENISKLFSKDEKDFEENLASSIQKVYENYFNNILEYFSKLYKSRNIIFAGGCALNSSANKSLIYNKKFDNVYIPYAPSDNGGSIGAALYVNEKSNIKKTYSNLSPYLGDSFSNEEVLKSLKKFKNLKYNEMADFKKLSENIAKNLSNGEIIGWFQDRMEFGPRALGNRSILADPRKKDMKELINKKIKRRENFRPFAPAVLEKYQVEWFDGNFKNIYMSSTMDVKKEKREKIPAVTHIDGTARVQTVSKKLNLKLYNLIEDFYKITDVPVILNTSFNENEPIVRTPNEAINCFLRTDLDKLVIQNIIVEKVL